jgi:hypothetical protein
MQIEMKSTVDITPELLAEVFCALDDDQMCKFFVEVHRRASESALFDNQWYYLGGHLRNCECSNEGTREMLRNIVHHMETSEHR